MSFKTPDSLAEQIAVHLGGKIISGELKPGDRVQELRVATELDVSRGSVREAFLILERRFLLDVIPRKGAVVSSLTTETVSDLFEVLTFSFQAVASKVAANWQENQLDEFVRIGVRSEQNIATGNLDGLVVDAADLYLASYAFVDNAYLSHILADIFPSAQRIMMAALSAADGDYSSILKFCRELLPALIARDVPQTHKVLADFFDEQAKLTAKSVEPA